MNPLAAHALLDRRAFLRQAVAAALTAGVAGTVLGACRGPGGSEAGKPGMAGGPGTAAPGTTFPPLAFDTAQPYWMQGGFAPVAAETEAFDLTVTGSLPKELTGLYVRNGSNPAGGPSPHWFLGDGMVHGVRLDAGRASWYRNRYVQTPLYQARRGVLEAGAPGAANNQANVSVFAHAGRLLASGEIGYPFELSAADLSTRGVYDYGGALRTAMTAHPKLDPATGRLHFFGYGFVPPYLTYHVVAPDGTLEYTAEVAVKGSTMIHDFAITDRDVIFWELPVVFDLEAAIRAVGPVSEVKDDGSRFPYTWDPSYGARIGIMPLGGPTAAIRWVEIPPCYVFHGVNAFRDGDDVVIDVCRMPTMFEHGGDPGPTAVHRWRIGTAAPALTFRDEVLSDREMDLPAIDRRFTGRTNRQSWFLLVDPLDAYDIEFSGLARRDGTTGTMDRYEPGPGYRLNEGSFVAGGPGEGEGWLLTYAWDRARGASDLVVLDALDLAKGPVARVHLPTRVPYGFHGTWVPGT